MAPLKIGAALDLADLPAHRDWLFEADRDVEIQDFIAYETLSSGFEDFISAAKEALDGHSGRRGIHGPFEGLDIDNKDPELRPIITARFLKAMEAAERIGARQMVLHSPYTLWYQNNLYASPTYAEDKLARIHEVLAPVVKSGEDTGVQIVIENIYDARPETRRAMVESFASPAIALSVDTGHAQIARRMSGGPTVEDVLRDAGGQLAHVHLQDLDGHADRHWAPGDGEIEWHGVFRALADCTSTPHLVLELRAAADIPKGFAYLRDQGLAQ
ncbi:sugar phosphate isomerase/epimerase family protein [Pseudoruegeria sp. SHC-113]|uniref:sugar phosphate isomerase/epimerase family protein n=1 Tax=Pseudoruegeria sp. SHC-113 TaxID=2855439 RepID=UPI0021BB50EE|nr:sugar phosphate isomerase/epimerase family protein [Pseudoruegeria sp. SHC-113]MCT8160197.1 sugar phosphate isomerase/epimerase [Pseudoruegeria sp. SHC-113]